jgi:beta-lactamase class D
MKKALWIILFAILSQSGLPQKVTEKDFHSVFARYGVDGCFVLYNSADNEYIKYNASLCDTGYIPASTFKIPNSLIALEEGVIKDTTQVIKWDGHVWPNALWNKDQTLRSAVRYSCIWVYFKVAEQVGIEKYQSWVNAFDYGNKNLTGPPTRFWLAGLFRISANQQIDFLKKFYAAQLPGISQRSIDIVKDLIVLEQNDQYRLSGKTGGGVLSDTEYIMWLVGYVEKGNKPYFFAMNFKTNDFDKTAPARYTITKDIMKILKVIE